MVELIKKERGKNFLKKIFRKLYSVRVSFRSEKELSWRRILSKYECLQEGKKYDSIEIE